MNGSIRQHAKSNDGGTAACHTLASRLPASDRMGRAPASGSSRAGQAAAAHQKKHATAACFVNG